jgi:hypothetical protein
MTIALPNASRATKGAGIVSGGSEMKTFNEWPAGKFAVDLARATRHRIRRRRRRAGHFLQWRRRS